MQGQIRSILELCQLAVACYANFMQRLHAELHTLGENEIQSELQPRWLANQLDVMCTVFRDCFHSFHQGLKKKRRSIMIVNMKDNVKG